MLTATLGAFMGIEPIALAYAGFVAVTLVLLALDLGVFHRTPHAVTFREALTWTIVWTVVALAFNAAVWPLYEFNVLGLGTNVPIIGQPGQTQTLDGWAGTSLFFAAYVVERSLSMDNLFVIAIIFTSLRIPREYQHRVLFWGIVGALLMRGAMIAGGAALIGHISWMTYVFGGILILTAARMAFASSEHADPSRSLTVRLLRRVMPVTDRIEGQRLFTRLDGRLAATPLFVALLVVEVTDVIFAVDSIPAVFAITADPFIVFSSNVMAILGLRAMYFCLASAMANFRFLKPALVAILLFVGVKMCLVHTEWKVPTNVSLAVIIGVLAVAVLSSVARGPGGEAPIPARGAFRPVARAYSSNRTLRRGSVLFAGTLVLLVGVAISPLPGPGLSVLGPLGLAILASEFLWARRLMLRAARHERGVRDVADQIFAGVSRVWIIPLVAVHWVGAWALTEYTPIPDWLVWTLAFWAFTVVMYLVFRWMTVRGRKAAQRRLSDSPASPAPAADTLAGPGTPIPADPARSGET